ncbi:hypothetical protein [Arsenophonus nasoniae]|uniref:hypothetical protein n=1 Tax=Arsenophonus nasoniae TaxID=638 RepID=UPI003879CFD0
MKESNKPDYEALGRCVFLNNEIHARIASLRGRVSHIHEVGFTPHYLDGNKPELIINQIVIDVVEELARETRDIYSEVYHLAREYNKWAALARRETITIKI